MGGECPSGRLAYEQIDTGTDNGWHRRLVAVVVSVDCHFVNCPTVAGLIDIGNTIVGQRLHVCEA